jgi:hypothetical protein
MVWWLILIGTTSGAFVHFRSDGVGNVGQLLALLSEVLGSSRNTVLLKPVKCFLDSIEKL